jgi:hypothetical protein
MALLTLTAFLLGLLASQFGVRFDGFLDVYLSGTSVPLGIALADQFVSLPLAAGVAWVIVRGFAASAHLDMLLFSIGTMRIVLVLLIAPVAVLIDQPVSPIPQWFLISIAAVIGTWSITLLVTGVRFVSGLKGLRLAGATLCLIICAELISEQALTMLTE